MEQPGARIAGLMIGIALAATAGALELTDPAAMGGRGQHGIAALAPIAGGDGWGRVELRAAGRSGTTVTDGLVLLYGIEPRAVHTVVVGGATVATVTTDRFGDASLRFGSHVGTAVQLPPGGGPAPVDVVDASWGLVLAGELELKQSIDDDAGGSTTVHEERVALDDVAGLGAVGVAKVKRSSDGEQELETRASGLDFGRRYEIRVDGILAGAVTADSVGQAWLELEAPDDSDPLPAALQPVEDLRLVQWLDDGGMPVLSGSFSGISQHGDDDGDDDGDRSLDGFVTGFTPDGFRLAAGAKDYSVVITPATVFEDVSGLGGLVIGDAVEVHGLVTGDVVTATRVERRGAHDDDDDDHDDDDDDDDDDNRGPGGDDGPNHP